MLMLPLLREEDGAAGDVLVAADVNLARGVNLAAVAELDVVLEEEDKYLVL